MTQLIIRMLPALVIIIRLHGWLGFPLTSEAMSTYLKFDIAIITPSHMHVHTLVQLLQSDFRALHTATRRIKPIQM